MAMSLWDTFAESDDEADPGSPDMDLTVYTQGDLFDPSDCAGGK